MQISSLQLSIFLLIASFSLHAQGDRIQLHPIRKNHKTGYVKFYPNASVNAEFIPPKYDYVGQDYLPYNSLIHTNRPSPYRAFELNERVGLLDKGLNEVLPNEYKRIRVLSEDYFAVEREKDFQLINADQKLLLKGEHYQNICIAIEGESTEQTHFFVQKGGLLGTVDMDGTVIIPPRYARMRPAGQAGYYKVADKKRANRWRLIDASGRALMPNDYENIVVLNDELVALQHSMSSPEGRILLWTIQEIGAVGQPFSELNAATGLEDQIYLEVERLNEKIVIVVTTAGEKVQLWDTQRRRRLSDLKSEQRINPKTQQPKTYPWYENLHGDYLKRLEMLNGRRESYRLIKEDGTLSARRYDEIENIGQQDVFRVKRGQRWGLLRIGIGEEDRIRCQYDTIYNFKEDIAITKIGSGYGAIALTADTIASIPSTHKNPRIKGKKIWLQHENNVLAYSLDERNQFRLDSFVTGGMFFSKNTKQFMENMPIKQSTLSNRYPTDLIYALYGDRIVKEISDSTALQVGKLPRQYLTPIPQAIISPTTAILTLQEGMIPMQFGTRFPPLLAKQLYVLDFQKKESLTDSLIIGFRHFPRAYNHTAFVRQDGKMGLINRKGEPMKVNGNPLQFTYIGEFKAGLARVYIGGELITIGKADKQILPVKFTLGRIGELINEFNITVSRDTRRLDKDRYIYAQGGYWGYINIAGKVVLKPDAPHIGDFHRIDSVARVYQLSERKDIYGNPDADLGLIDRQGEIIVPIKYDKIAIEEMHYRVYKKGTPTYFFTQRGHQIFKNRTRLRPFSEGLAQFYDAEGRWGYVDEEGIIVIAPQFKQARPFSDGRAMVVGESGFCAFIDKTGEIVFETKIPARGHLFVGDFHEGRAWFKAVGKYIWSCYDKTGKIVIPPRVYYKNTILAGRSKLGDELNPLQMDYAQGAASVELIDSLGKRKYVLIDSLAKPLFIPKTPIQIARLNANGVGVYTETGKKFGLISAKKGILTPARYHRIDTFRNTYARVRTEAAWGVIDINGKELIVPQYQGMGKISENLVAVKSKDQADWYYINLQNRLAFKGTFQQAGVFEQGVAKVSNGKGKPYYIDDTGERIEFAQTKIVSFSEGVFGVKNRDKRFFFADQSGNNRFVGRDFFSIAPYRRGIAKVKPEKRGKYGAINIRGVMVLPPKYAYIHQQSDGNIIVNPQSYMGLLDKQGKTVLAPEYDAIHAFSIPDFYRVESGEEMGYVSVQNGKIQWLWELQK